MSVYYYFENTTNLRLFTLLYAILLPFAPLCASLRPFTLLFATLLYFTGVRRFTEITGITTEITEITTEITIEFTKVGFYGVYYPQFISITYRSITVCLIL